MNKEDLNFNFDRPHQKLPYRLLLSLLATFFIMDAYEFDHLGSMTDNPAYTFNTLSTFAISQFIMEYMRLYMKKVYFIYSRPEDSAKKTVAIGIGCIIVPFLAIFLIVAIYYWYTGYSIWNTDWANIFAGSILMMLVILRFYLQPKLTATPTQILSYTTPVFHGEDLKEVAYVEALERRICVYLNDGTFDFKDTTLDKFLKKLLKRHFIHIRKNCIIWNDNIKESILKENGTYEVYLISPAGKVVNVSISQGGKVEAYRRPHN